MRCFYKELINIKAFKAYEDGYSIFALVLDVGSKNIVSAVKSIIEFDDFPVLPYPVAAIGDVLDPIHYTVTEFPWPISPANFFRLAATADYGLFRDSTINIIKFVADRIKPIPEFIIEKEDVNAEMLRAAERGHADIVAVLIEEGVDVNDRKFVDWAAHYLATHGQTDSVTVVLKKLCHEHNSDICQELMGQIESLESIPSN